MPDRRVLLVPFRRRGRAPAIPTPHPLRQGDHPRGGPRKGLRGPRERRGVRGRRQGPPAGALGEQPALVRAEPAALRVLPRAADAEGRERLRPLRPPAARHGLARVGVRGRLAVLTAAAAIAVAGCGNGNEKASDTTTTAQPSTAPAPATTPTQKTPTTPTSTTPYSTAPQAPGEGDGNGGAAAPGNGNGGVTAP